MTGKPCNRALAFCSVSEGSDAMYDGEREGGGERGMTRGCKGSSHRMHSGTGCAAHVAT